MLYLVEEKVQMGKAINDTPVIPETADVTPTPWSQFTKTAVLGDATAATREKGEKIISAALANMTKMIQQAKDELGC
jgi:creatinine amidohydrolase